jgi:hypothetical protein
MSLIQPLEQRVFTLQEGTIPWVKMWDYDEIGLSILVSSVTEDLKCSNAEVERQLKWVEMRKYMKDLGITSEVI